VIELVRSQLDDREQRRWQAALAQLPIVARRRPRMDPELWLFGATLWIAPFVLTFERWSTPLWWVLVLRGVATAAWLLSARGALRSYLARGAVWPRGRFLFRWGYAEIDDDVLRVMPMQDLAHEIRGRFLGMGPIRLRLRAAGWSAALTLHADEVERVATALEETGTARVAIGHEGYRDATPAIEGPRARWRPPEAMREMAWAMAAGVLGVAIPATFVEAPTRQETPGAAHADGDAEDVRVEPPGEAIFREPYASAILPASGEAWNPAVLVDIGPCMDTADVASHAADRLRLGLASPPRAAALGGLGMFGAPTGLPRPYAAARVWASCTWELDYLAGTLARARALWGLDRRGTTVIEREAVVEVADVIRVIDECDLEGHGASVSPDGLAIASLTLLQGAIRRDLYESVGSDEEPPYLSSSVRPCVAQHIAEVAVTHRREP
jgi:hypothetical protein